MTVSFNKARGRWTYDFWHRKTRHQGYCLDAAGQPVTSKTAARQAEAVERRRLELAPKLARGKDTTLAQVIADLQPRWMREADWPNKKRYAREIIDFFGSSTAITAINDAQCLRYIEFASTRPIRVWVGAQSGDRSDDELWKDTGKRRSPATVNRHLAFLRLLFQHATKMRDPVTNQPILARVPEFSDLPEIKRRARPTPEPVLERLMELLPQHAIDGLVVTLCFGFRSSEAFSLQEPQVDWHAEGVRLFGEDVKDSEDVFLPGSQFAMGYLRCLAMEAEARGMRHLISYRREATRNPDRQEPWRPIKRAKTAWGTAMDVIEKEFGRRWRWHDLRAAFITHVAMTSGPVAAQALARHSNFDTTRAYIEVANEVTRQAAARAVERPALRVVGAKKSP